MEGGKKKINFNIRLNWLHRVTMCYLVNAKHTHARTHTLTKTGQRRPNK